MSSAVIASTTLDPNRSAKIFARISRLPKWRTLTKPEQPLMPIHSISMPSNSMLLKVCHELHISDGTSARSLELSTKAVDDVTKICKGHYFEIAANDFDFILETIRGYSTSQQQFWESMATLVRYSISHRGLRSGKTLATTINGRHIQVDEFWPQNIADTISSAFWSESSSEFMEQIEQAWDREYSTLCEREYVKARNIQACSADPSSDTAPLALEMEAGATRRAHCSRQHRSSPLDVECLAHVLIDALLLKKHTKRALILYDRLSELGFMMPSRLLASFIRIAVTGMDRYQLERIGKMLLEHERIYTDTTLARHSERCLNRPLLMSSKLMDSFIHGASECELYDIARAVFQKGLQAGKHYRISTYTMVLNTYSVKEFGFDVVAAAETYRKEGLQAKLQGHPRQKSGDFESRSTATANKSNGGRAARGMTPADPAEIDMYISSMESHGAKPSATTLNVLVKLYLEMAQYKVPGAPSWMSAFKRYNPLGLSPDLVTNNTLLAYYEKHKDLDTMRKIYNDMVAKDPIKNVTRPSRSKMGELEILPELEDSRPPADGAWGDGQSPITEQANLQSESLLQDHYNPSQTSELRKVPYVRSNRDIFTYNIMLHALLQHAVETKDLASIGQCFHDMELDGIQADTVTFNTNILYHITRGDLAAALQVFKSMDLTSARNSSPFSKSKPVKSTQSMQPRLHNRDKKLEQTPDSRDDSEAASDAPSRPMPDVVTLTSLISGFGRAKQMDKAAQFFKDMTSRYGLEPNLKTYSTLVAALHRTGDHIAAESLWDIVLKDDANTVRKDRKSDKEDEDFSLPLEKTDMLEQLAESLKRESPLTIMERRQIEARKRMAEISSY
ncbi:hypothetical protein EMPS_10864 [Entomortierella parvispora]|uniref:Pentacotripeptide-repeat region of PRORP domain-containing protein n=1 Tax=Entomortierella parvispora TaxID=205924 RepID=A0A9P3M1Y3_9FUNG|nr:hypothetical protein EMPS_10864 [Entomortierella parvispora]